MTVYFKDFKKDIDVETSVYFKAYKEVPNARFIIKPNYIDCCGGSSTSIVNIFPEIEHSYIYDAIDYDMYKTKGDTKQLNAFLTGLYYKNSVYHIFNIMLPSIYPVHIFEVSKILSMFHSVHSTAKVYGFYPGNAETITFRVKSNVVISDIPSELIDGFIKTSNDSLMYTGEFFSFNTLNHPFFTSLEYIIIYKNFSPLTSQANNKFLINSKIYPLLDYMNGSDVENSVYERGEVGTIKIHYSNFFTENINFINTMKSKFNTTIKSTFYSLLDDNNKKLEPLAITLYKEIYYCRTVPLEYSFESKSSIRSKHNDGKLIAIFLGNYCTLSVTYINKAYVDGKKFKYTTNSNGTYTVLSEDNIDQIGSLWILDEDNYPLALSTHIIKNITLIDMLKRKNIMISYCKNNNITNPYINNTEIVDEYPYSIGTITTKETVTVSDIPAKLSLLDNY